MSERHTRQGMPSAAISQVRGPDDYEPRDYQSRKSLRGGSALSMPVLAGKGCWCGQPMGHDWPGKTEGMAHPR